MKIANDSNKGVMQKLNDNIDVKLEELNKANYAIQRALDGLGEKIAKEISFEMGNIAGDAKEQMDAIRTIVERMDSVRTELQTASDSICGAIDHLTQIIESSSVNPEG